jgi:hypothetical protein
VAWEGALLRWALLRWAVLVPAVVRMVDRRWEMSTLVHIFARKDYPGHPLDV